MIRRQDFFVLLLYYMGFSGCRNLILRLQHKPVTRFLALHDILPEAFFNFKTNMYFLKKNTNVVSIEDFFSGRLSSEKINVVITFDDGYKSWLSYAIPVLKDLGLPATFFVTSGFVGLSKENESGFLRSKLFMSLGPRRITGGLTGEGVRRIVEEGFIIGGHTVNHCNLGRLKDGGQIRYEIGEDKTKLEKITGVKIEYFAYPSGAYYNPDIDLVEALKESGYKGAVTAEPGFNSAGTSPYLLHRELTGAAMPIRVFRARVYGNYDGVLFMKRLTSGKYPRLFA